MQTPVDNYMNRNGDTFYYIWGISNFIEDAIRAKPLWQRKFLEIDLMYLELLCCGSSGFNPKNKEKEK